MSKEIKSTLELAMEKAAKLPRLTKEELRKQREKEFGPRAWAIANRFLSGDLTEDGLTAEISVYPNEEGEIIRATFLEAMCEAINLGAPEKTSRAFDGLRAVFDEALLREAASRVEDLSRHYEQRQQAELAATEETEWARVQARGISGSAILRLNLRESEIWRRKEADLRTVLEPQLNEIKETLKNQLLCAP